LKGVGLRGKIMSQVFSRARFTPVNADWFPSDGMSLIDFGCDAKIIETPGHTAGSISIVTNQGDGIIGDVIMGGWMGGVLHRSRPNYHYFADDLTLAMQSLDLVLRQTTARLFVGHGGPLLHDRVKAWRERA
jgi:glyoxylase-like metal-dependent hydrolase (beta-lactamase superfamily II)